MNQPTVLDRGPVATVHAARVAGKPVVWKVFPARFDRRTLAAVHRERARLSALSAPILPVDAVERWDRRHALRMEWCPESLGARIRRVGPLSVGEVVALGHSLALALAAAHRAGVLHGAVNPANVLFRASGQPVLADFGIAWREAFPCDPSHAIEYVPPETLRTRTVTEQSDMYGLGTVLYVALTGCSPRPGLLGEQQGQRVLRVLRSPVPAVNRPDVPIGLATVLARLLADDAADRPPDAAWVVTRLADMLPRRPDGDAEQPPAVSPAGRSWHRRLVVGGVALLVVLAVVLTAGLRDNGSGDGRASGRTTPPATLVTAGVELAAPRDFGDHVVLNWTSRRVLDFVVVVEGARQPSRYLWVERNHTVTLPVDPARGYCFVVRGTNGNQVFESRPEAVHGADCHE